MPQEPVGGPASFGERLGHAQQNLPQRPGDSRVAPGTALGGAAGHGGAAEGGKPPSAERDPNSVTPGGGDGGSDDTPSQNTGGSGGQQLGHSAGHTDGGGGSGSFGTGLGGGSNPEGIGAGSAGGTPTGGGGTTGGGGLGGAAGGSPGQEDRKPAGGPYGGMMGGFHGQWSEDAGTNRGSGAGQRSGPGAVDGVLNLDATGRPRPSGGGGDTFRPLPTSQPGAGQGQDGVPAFGDFRKNPGKKENPFGRVIVKPGQGPRSPDPVAQPPAGPDGSSTTLMRSTRKTPLQRRMEHTDPAAGSGGAMAQ